MGKQLFQSLPDEPVNKKSSLRDIVVPIEPDSRENIRPQVERIGGFKGDSQYDTGLVFGVDQNYNRAVNQPVSHEIGNAILKTIPAIPLGILENTGYIGDLLFDWDGSKDYTNALTEIAQAGRDKLEENNPNYRKNPNEVFDLKDSAWWVNNGQGLVESIGEFFVTGAGVGAGLSKSARGIQQLISKTKQAEGIGQGLAQLGTASSLAYTEGAMSGAQIYKDVYSQKLEETGNAALANQLASEAAAHTVMLNTVINTGLNLTSVNALFKTFNNTKIREALTKGVNEKLPDYLNRLTKLESSGLKEASKSKALILEATQEGLEEDVNLFAEKEGRIRGGLEKSKGNFFDRFINSSLTQEGILNFALGAVGGIGQKAGIDYIPYRSYKDFSGKSKIVNNNFLNQVEGNQALKEQIFNLKTDLNSFVSKQADLTKAIASKDQELIKQAKESLYNIASFKSIRDDNSDLLANELKEIASTDNTNINPETGKTAAQEKGYSDSVNDNEYKEIALRKASELGILQKDYNDLKYKFENKIARNKAFELAFDYRSGESLLADYNKKLSLEEIEATNLATDPSLGEPIKTKARLQAINNILKDIDTERATTDNKHLNNTYNFFLKKKKDLEAINEQTDYVDGKPVTTNPFDKKLKENKPIIDNLVFSYKKLYALEAKNDFDKRVYREAIGNPKKFTEKINKEFTDSLKDIKDSNQEQNKEATKQQQEQDLTKASIDTNPEPQTISTFGQPQVEKSELSENQQPTKEVSQLNDKEKQYAASAISNLTNSEAYTNPNNSNYKPLRAFISQELKINPDSSSLLDIKELNNNWIENRIKNKPQGTKQIDSINKDTDIAFYGDNNPKQTIELQNKTLQEYAITENATTGEQNKFAYLAQPYDTNKKTSNLFSIDSRFQLLHSKSFNVGTLIEIKPAGDDTGEYYKPENIDQLDYIDTYSLGIYHNNKLISYVPINRYNNQQLRLIRRFALKSPINTTVSAKDIGVLNKQKTSINSLEAFPVLDNVDFVIGKNGNYYIDTNSIYDQEVINRNESQSGFVYASVYTPNGKKIAIPLDINKASKEIALSIVTTTRLYTNQKSLTKNQIDQLEIIFNEYGYNLLDQKDFQRYINDLVPTTDLRDPIKIVGYNNEFKDGIDHYYLQTTNNGIRYMRSGGAYMNKTTNTLQPYEITEGSDSSFYENLQKHVENMFVRIDLSKIKSNEKLKLPLLNISQDNETITVNNYEFNDYKQYIANNTRTNVVGVKISDNEMTVFVQPKIFFDTKFLEEAPKKIESYTEEKPAQKVILAPSENPFGSLTSSLPESIVDSNQVSDQQAQERKDKC